MTLFGTTQLRGLIPHKQKLIFSYKQIHSRNSALTAYANIRNSFEESCILESATGPEKLAELSIIVFDPYYVLKATNDEIQVEDRRNSTSASLRNATTDPLKFVQEIVRSNPTNTTRLRFAGGAVGYIGYDSIRYWEFKLVNGRKPQTDFADMQFCFYQEGIVFDHQKRKTYYFVSDQTRDRALELQDVINRQIDPSTMEFSYSNFQTNVKQDKYEKSVEVAKNYIREGDIFQVVLSKRFNLSFKGELLRFYSELRNMNPSPYMYYFDFGKTSIVGSSPEMLVRVEKGIIQTYPIAGTRPVTDDKNHNRKLAVELLSDPKERAEHIMLVDLARNDVGKVADFGTVSVPEFMRIKRFSRVQHIVSKVQGTLNQQFDSFDALRSIFPAGTVSGAPKIRAMEVIDELETDSRGPYAGAVGYFSFNGNMDSAITIRTLIACENRASIQTGAGIVADSRPSEEWLETEHKAKGLFEALELSMKKGDKGK